MSRIRWDRPGERYYETGVDRGVLYTANDFGGYNTGVPWNGLSSVNESPDGAEPNPIYADNMKYLNLMSAEEFKGTIEAYTYPNEWAECDGSVEMVPGVTIGQQDRRGFGLCYRTILGNDTLGNKYGYKIHIAYGGKAQPSEKANETVNDTPEANTFSWEFDTTPIEIEGFQPSALLIVDSTNVDATNLKALEDILYGTSSSEPRLPLPEEVADIIGFGVDKVTPVKPEYDSGSHELTIPTVVGFKYLVNDVETPAGVKELTVGQRVIVRAVPEAGYVVEEGYVTIWDFAY